MFSLEKYVFRFVAHFLIGLFIFLCLILLLDVELYDLIGNCGVLTLIRYMVVCSFVLLVVFFFFFLFDAVPFVSFAFVLLPESTKSLKSCLPHGLQPTRLRCPWTSPGQNTGVGRCALLQGIFPGIEAVSPCGSCIVSRFFTTEPFV